MALKCFEIHLQCNKLRHFSPVAPKKVSTLEVQIKIEFERPGMPRLTGIDQICGTQILSGVGEPFHLAFCTVCDCFVCRKIICNLTGEGEIERREEEERGEGIRGREMDMLFLSPGTIHIMWFFFQRTMINCHARTQAIQARFCKVLQSCVIIFERAFEDHFRSKIYSIIAA